MRHLVRTMATATRTIAKPPMSGCESSGWILLSLNGPLDTPALRISAVPDPTFSWARPASLVAASGKRVVIVGGTGGLGRELALASSDAGADVTVVGRSFRDGPASKIKFIKADLESMKEASRVGAELSSAPWDIVVLTTGIISAPKREATAEGLERDLAISYLSRLAILDVLAPRLAETPTPSRVFVMGFPGAGEAGMLGDLNAEKRPYEQFKVYVYMASHCYLGYQLDLSFPSVACRHMNSVAGNEALVLSMQRHFSPRVDFFGLNPGLVSTGIRANALGGSKSWSFWAIESFLGLFTMSPAQYGAKTAPLLFAPELSGQGGRMFNQSGTAIRPSEVLSEERVEAILAESRALLARALAT